MLTRVRAFFKDGVQKVRHAVERQDIYMVLLIILVGGGSFGLGILSGKTKEKPLVRIENAFPQETVGESLQQNEPQSASIGEEDIVATTQQGTFVGSKNSDKYHYPWCPGAQRIKEENKVWFATREEAEAAGYTPAANCKGL